MSLTPDGFALGYDGEAALKAKAALRAAGGYATVRKAAGPIPPAMTLASYRSRSLEQGGAGTCWLHAPVQLAEIVANAHGYDGFPICRRLVGYVGQKIGGRGNPTDGGYGLNALKAMATDKGVGIAHESLCPYSDERWTLGTKPPQVVYDDAKLVHLNTIVDVRDIDEAKTLVAAKQPVCLGMVWTHAWDTGQTFQGRYSWSRDGHEILMMGYVEKGVFDDYEWIHVDNWHGKQQYPVLSAALAAKLPGYMADGRTRTSDTFIRRDYLEQAMGSQPDMCSAADIDGLASHVLEINLGDGLV